MSDGNKASASETSTSAVRETERRGPKRPVAVVLAGAGARGAYEAGFIATLLPRLNPRPTIFVGTSAGAINAALLASVAHLPPQEAGDTIMKSWSNLRKKDVFGPIWKSVPLALGHYALALVSKREPPQSLLDVSPLAASLGRPELLDWHAIRANLREGKVDVLAFAATETGSGRTKVFYDTKANWNAPDKFARLSRSSSDETSNAHAAPPDETQAIDYIKTALDESHVRASAAIPLLFPPVRLEVGARTSFFLDGGLRLNAPLKPAIQFGAEGLVVVSTDPRHFGTSLAIEPRPPTMQGQVLQVLRGLFSDRMIEDIRTLLNRNRFIMRAKEQGCAPPDDRIIPLIFGGPIDQDRLGGIAGRAIKDILRGVPLFRLLGNIDVALLDRLTSPSATSGPDLISYVLFEPEFLKLALRAGIQDASALLNDYPDDAELWFALEARDLRRIRAHKQSPATTPLATAPAA